MVAQLTRSTLCTVCCSWSGSQGMALMPFPLRSATSLFVESKLRPQTYTVLIGRTFIWAGIKLRAIRPVPTISIVLLSSLDKYLDANADAAAVRLEVSSPPSS